MPKHPIYMPPEIETPKELTSCTFSVWGYRNLSARSDQHDEDESEGKGEWDG